MQDRLDSPKIRHHLATMAEAYLVLSQSPEARRPCYLIDYILESSGPMTAIIGSRSGLQLVESPFEEEVLMKGLGFYRSNLLALNPRRRYSGEYLDNLRKAVTMLYDIFIGPISESLEVEKQPHLIINVADAMDRTHPLYPDISSLDFQFLFDVRHRFGMASPNEDILITNVHPTLKIAQTVKNLEKFHQPQPKDLLILFALRSDGEGRISPENLDLYQNALAKAEEKGATVKKGATVEDFFHAICCDCNQQVVQLIAHHDSDGIQMSDGYISQRGLKERMIDLAERGQLRDDINLDVYCCDAFPYLAETLYQWGARLVFSSPQQIPVWLAACFLLEFYSGRNSIYPDPSYLDGATYIHEAWHKVTRSFYLKSYRGEAISWTEQQ